MSNEGQIKVKPVIHSSWLQPLKTEFESEYFAKLKLFLVEELKTQQIFPPASDIFNAFNITPFENVKVVILGQDPYHGKGQAHGLSFSVPPGIKPPPSLSNIYKELNKDLKIEIPNHGNLENWAKQGVFLLNATLTVRASSPGSHQGKGWEKFTDQVISKLSEKRKDLVFILWGRYAQNKEILIDESKHLILKSPHPSPFSAYSGFFGSQPFSKANKHLERTGNQTIDWRL